MILANENIHYFIIKTLREASFPVISLSEMSKGIKDEQVLQWAIQNNDFFSYFTLDKFVQIRVIRVIRGKRVLS